MPGRKERELQFRVEIVLDAALELFTDSSYEETSVEAIARGAEISVATLYTLFESKREIYKATIARAHDRFFADLLARVGAVRGPLEHVREIVRFHLEHFSCHERDFRAFARIDNVAGMELKREVEREATNGKREFFELVVGVCARGIDEGVFARGLRPELMALALMSIPHSILSHWLEQEQGSELLELVPQALAMAERLVGAA